MAKGIKAISVIKSAFYYITKDILVQHSSLIRFILIKQ